MKKKIVISLGVIAIVAAIAIGGTIAYFSDTESSVGNTFKAGKFNLQIDNTCQYNGKVCEWNAELQKYFWQGTGEQCFCSWSAKDLNGELYFNLLDVKPGDNGEDTISLHVDNNDAWMCAEIANVKSDDNGCDSPENKVDSTCGAGQGELQNNLFFTIWNDNGASAHNCNNIKDEDETYIIQNQTVQAGYWPIADSSLGAPLQGGTTHCLGVKWNVPLITGNEIQTDSLLADIIFTAVQSRNMPEFICNATGGCAPTNGGVEICGNGIDEDCDQVIDEGCENATLTIGKSDASPAGDITPDSDTILASFNFSADDFENINVTKIKIKDIGSDPACLQNVKIFEGTTQIGPTISALTGNEAEFSGLNLVIPQAVLKTLTVKSDTTLCINSCNTHQIQIFDDTDVDATGASSGSDSNVSGLPATGNIITIGSSVETCNGLDDDCDGAIDEGNPGGGSACSTGLLGICSAGTLTCSAGTLSCVQNIQPVTEICGNGTDDDCDGSVDEDCSVCTPTNNGVETCDGVDNDCDGLVDEGGVCDPEANCHDGIDDDGDGQIDCADYGCFLNSLDCNPVCPDGTCSPSETNATCAADCPPPAPQCTSDAQCTNTNECTSGACVSGVCVYTPHNNWCFNINSCITPICSTQTGCSYPVTGNIGTSCSDLTCLLGGNCNGYTCSAIGACVAPLIPPGGCTSNADCNDNNSCTNDSCLGIVCQHTNIVAGQCIFGGTCSGGVVTCNPNPSCPNNCDDGNACTTDTCEMAGCAHNAVTLPSCTNLSYGYCDPNTGQTGCICFLPGLSYPNCSIDWPPDIF